MDYLIIFILAIVICLSVWVAIIIIKNLRELRPVPIIGLESNELEDCEPSLSDKDKELLAEIGDRLVDELCKIPGIKREVVGITLIEGNNLLLFSLAIHDQRSVVMLSQENQQMIRLLHLITKERPPIQDFEEALKQGRLPIYDAECIIAGLNNALSVIAVNPKFTSIIKRFSLQAEFSLIYTARSETTKIGRS